MGYEKIVGVFDSAGQAQGAVDDLMAAGAPPQAIEVYGPEKTRGSAEDFWSSLFGSSTSESDRDVYSKSVDSGGHVVAIHVHGRNTEPVCDILERNGAVDVDERAESYGHKPAKSDAATPPKTGTKATGEHKSSDQQRMELSKEELNVGKREVGGGKTRLRRYTVEEPVEESVRLRDENVKIERHPVNRPAKPGEHTFTDKTIEATERHEKPVVSKEARVVEEVGLRKETNEHVEKVRDTVRHDEVDVEKTRDGEQPRQGRRG